MDLNTNSVKEQTNFTHDPKIQTFKYTPYNQNSKIMPAKIMYQKEADGINHQYQGDVFESHIDQKRKLVQQFESSSNSVGQQYFKMSLDQQRGNQMKEQRPKQSQSSKNLHKFNQNQSLLEASQSKNILKIVDEQMHNQQNTYTTQIIKKSANIDFDLSRSLKNNFSQIKDSAASNFLKRKSVAEFKNNSQPQYDNLLSPSNRPNQGLFSKAAEQSQANQSSRIRHQSLDLNHRYQNNNIQLPSIVNNNSNSPSIAQKVFYNSNNQEQNTNKSDGNNPIRSSFLSYFSNQGETANSTPSSNLNRQNLYMKDSLLQQLEQKQFLQMQMNNQEIRVSPSNNKFQSILGQNQSKQEVYDAIFSKYEKSFQQQGDEYLSNRRKSNLHSSKVSFSNPSTPQNSKQNFNKQNQNSQFYKMNASQQYGTPKIINHEMFQLAQEKFTFDNYDSHQKQGHNYLLQQSESPNQYHNKQQDKDQNSRDNSLNNGKQINKNNTNNKEQVSSLTNFGNLAESTNLTYSPNPQNANNLSIKIGNNEYNNDIKSPNQQIQSITLKQITLKDFEQIKEQCLNNIRKEIFSEDYHKHSFENAANMSCNQQIETIITFVSLCFEELQQDFFKTQVDHSSPSFVNFKEIETTSYFSFNQLSISSMNHCVNWPKLSFQYPQKFCQMFVERVTSLLEQNDLLKKKIQYVKKLVSYNFKKYFCYKDFLNEIRGPQNISIIIDKVIKNIEKVYKQENIVDYISDIKTFTFCLLEGDQAGLDKIISKHLILPNYNNNDQSQLQENETDLQTQHEQKIIQNQPSKSQENLEGKTHISISQSRLSHITRIKITKNNIFHKDKIPSAKWKFNPINMFDIKISIFNTLIEEEFVSSQSIMKILEQIETLRYGTFRCFFGNDVTLNYLEHVKNILNLVPENQLHQLLNHSALGSVKRDYQLFFNQFCELIFLQNSSTQSLKALCNSQNINLNNESFFFLENQVNYVVNAMKIIPLCQRKDIKLKLMKLKRLLNISESFDHVYDNIIEIINDLQIFIDKQLVQNKQLTVEQIKSIKYNFKYFQYLLHSVLCTEGAFSNYDMGFAFQDHEVKEDSLNFWIKSLKRVLQNHQIKSQVIINIEQILIEIIQSKIFI